MRHSKTFAIRRGLNISHWLSQSGKRGDARRKAFRREDVRFIADTGFDHLRLPLDEEQLWTPAGEREPEAFDLLHEAVGWCREAGLRVIADLHTLRSHHFNAEGAGSRNSLFESAEAEERFRGLWRDLSEELRDYERDLVAYELLNEPTAARSEDWNRVAGAVRRTIRQEEPERLLVLGSNRWQSPDRVAELELPEEDPNLLISVHCYFPHLLTHYRAHWMALGRYQGPVDYPGVVVEEAALADLPAELREAALQPWISGFHDRDRLAEYFKAPLSIAAAAGLRLHCGEFGCIINAPRTERLRWYADMIAVFNAFSIPWTAWDYQGGFRLRDPRTGQVDGDLLEIMMR